MRQIGGSRFQATWSYDPVGNRLAQWHDGETTQYRSDAANRTYAAITLSGRTTYSYDAAGNQTAIEVPSGDITATTWDFDSRQKSVEQSDGSIVSFTYNCDHWRVAKQDAFGTVGYQYDKNNLFAELDGLAVQVQYTNEPNDYGNLVSQYRSTDDESSYYAFDVQGSTIALTDSSAVVTDDYEYEAWGDVVAATGTTANPVQYIGQLGYYRDQEIHRTHVRRREYDQMLGRFFSEDPTRQGSGDDNLYRYVKNDPVNTADPSGLAEIGTHRPKTYNVIEGEGGSSFGIPGTKVFWATSISAGANVNSTARKGCPRTDIGKVVQPSGSRGTTRDTVEVELIPQCGGCIVTIAELDAIAASTSVNFCNMDQQTAILLIRNTVKKVCAAPTSPSATGTGVAECSLPREMSKTAVRTALLGPFGSGIASVGQCLPACPPPGSVLGRVKLLDQLRSAAEDAVITMVAAVRKAISTNETKDVFEPARQILQEMQGIFERGKKNGLVTAEEADTVIALLQASVEFLTELENALPKDAVGAALDVVQLVLSVIGLAPALGDPADIIDAAISAVRGDIPGAALGGLSALPALGSVFGGAGIAFRVSRLGSTLADFSAAVLTAVAKYRARIYKLFKNACPTFANWLEAILKKLDDLKMSLSKKVDDTDDAGKAGKADSGGSGDATAGGSPDAGGSAGGTPDPKGEPTPKGNANTAVSLPPKVLDQIKKAQLPLCGSKPFKPKLVKNKAGDLIIEKAPIKKGPKKGKPGYVDQDGNIWIKDRAHAGDPDHWDVQIDGGEDYFRVGLDGEPL